MKIIKKERGSVYADKNVWSFFNEQLESFNFSKIFILVDLNTKELCLPYFLNQIKHTVQIEILEIPSGEEHKNISSCLTLWEQLSEKRADRKSLLINLGGGVVTDLGGFIGCTFKRGIEFINIPTSLLAMVDASIGGKNGLDLGSLKNQIGVIKNPLFVIIDNKFLDTLPEIQFTSGMAEMLKHGLIHSETYLNKIVSFDKSNKEETSELIWESIKIKNEVVTEDPFETGLRKTLNYGHTLGHAIESYCMETSKKNALLHGEAVAIGMILETYISSEILLFPKEKLNFITEKILLKFSKITFSKNDIEAIINLLIYDKKNSNGKVLFVLLKNIGHYKADCEVPNELIFNAFEFYENF